MTKQSINIVWMKRDLRSQDHQPLHQAQLSGLPYIIMFLFEPLMMQQPDCSLRHLQFQYQSLQELNKILGHHHIKINIFCAEAFQVFEYLKQNFEIKNLYSYQEIGTKITYDRDKAVASFCQENGIQWQQYQRDGVIRNPKSKQHWHKQWFTAMHSEMIINDYNENNVIGIDHPFALPSHLEQEWQNYPKAYQPAGEKYARQYLKTFMTERGYYYSKNISKPQASRMSCSRLSPYLAWGNLSLRQAYQMVYHQSKNIPAKRNFANFLTRLLWHCHFMQKFEINYHYQTHCINKGYELLEHEQNPQYISQWEQGVTGLPLVDACMRCLEATGWLNFRMRAMLVSVFCHHLYQDWRQGIYHLARLFLDYEPGIHYPQFQMQAGVTGINTIRIYNPIKQSQEQDPDGVFIKKWLPVLQNVPKELVHQPHLMTAMEQQLYGVQIGHDYPQPIIDVEASGKVARKQIWEHRQHPLVQQENQKVLQQYILTQ